MATKEMAEARPKLYQYEACPFCAKVRAFLSYKGIPYEKVEVHPLNKKEIAFSKNYRKVPILVDTDGRQINDSTNILRYLEEKHPEQPLFEEKDKYKEREATWLKHKVDDGMAKA